MFRDRESRGVGGKEIDPSCRVYVSNLPYDYKWQELKDAFRKEVGNVAYVELFDDDMGRPKGAGIVDFESSEMAELAITKMHNYDARGRKITVTDESNATRMRDFKFMFEGNRPGGFRTAKSGPNRFNDRMGGGSGGGAGGIVGNTYGLSVSFLESLGISGQLCRSVFVSNLSFQVTSDDLKEAFAVAGKVKNAKVMFNDEGKSRGFGVIEYDHPIQSVQAISMLNNQMYFDRRMTVRMDRVPEKNSESNSSNLPRGLSSLGMGLGQNGQAITDVKDIPAGGNFGNHMSNLGGGPFDNASSNLNIGLGAVDPVTLVSQLAKSGLASNLISQMMGMSASNSNNSSTPPNNNFGGAFSSSSGQGSGRRWN